MGVPVLVELVFAAHEAVVAVPLIAGVKAAGHALPIVPACVVAPGVLGSQAKFVPP